MCLWAVYAWRGSAARDPQALAGEDDVPGQPVEVDDPLDDNPGVGAGVSVLRDRPQALARADGDLGQALLGRAGRYRYARSSFSFFR